MIVFGLISTVFDLVLSMVLLRVLHADPEVFRTAWFVGSLLTELAALLLLRSSHAVHNSLPSALLGWSSALVTMIALALPYAGSVADLFALVPLDFEVMAALLLVVLLYALVTEIAKRRHHLLGPHDPRPVSALAVRPSQ